MQIVKLIISILVCQAAGAVGSVFTRSSIPDWYAFLNKPSFNPPNWVFAPVWSALYSCMGIAMFLLWMKAGQDSRAKPALWIFFLQLALNSAWSIVFFGMRSPGGALAVIIALWFAIFLTIWKFSAISRPAAVLLTPYILWVSFAAILNLFIVILN